MTDLIKLHNPYDFANPVSDSDIRSYAGFEQSSTPNLPLNLNSDRLVFESTAFDDFTQEPVPPVTKKCGDTLIQGSNNSMKDADLRWLII